MLLNKEIMAKFIESWDYLRKLDIVHYKGVSQFGKCLTTEVVKTNPSTLEIDDNKELNTKVQVWLEFGGIVKDEHLGIIPEHDIDLDCGADTFEEAIIELARLCKEKGYKTYKHRNITDDDIKQLEELYNNQ